MNGDMEHGDLSDVLEGWQRAGFPTTSTNGGEVLVEGNWFPVPTLPSVVRSLLRALDQERRDAKEQEVRRVRALDLPSSRSGEALDPLPVRTCGWDGPHDAHVWSSHATDMQCTGRRAHSATSIGGRHDGIPARYGQIDLGGLTGE